MDEQEIKDWLGVPEVRRPLLAGIVEGMRLVPVPHDDTGLMLAFAAFLRCAPANRGEGIFAADTQRWLGLDGRVFEARYADPPTAYRWDDEYNHQLIRPKGGQVIQPVTLCGKRGLEVPGRGNPDCLRRLAESRSRQDAAAAG